MSAVEVPRTELATVANHLRIISHPSRLAIALLLLDGPCAVSVIESALDLRQPNLSQHLGVLRDANILAASRQAKSVTYALRDGLATELLRSIATALQSADVGHASTVETSARPVAAATSSTAGESDDASMFAQIFARRVDG